MPCVFNKVSHFWQNKFVEKGGKQVTNSRARERDVCGAQFHKNQYSLHSAALATTHYRQRLTVGKHNTRDNDDQIARLMSSSSSHEPQAKVPDLERNKSTGESATRDARALAASHAQAAPRLSREGDAAPPAQPPQPRGYPRPTSSCARWPSWPSRSPGLRRHAVRTARYARGGHAYPVRTVRDARGQAALCLRYVPNAGGWYA